MQLVKVSEAAIKAAAARLGAGGLVAFPTETVYGLGADATSGEAVARLYAVKGRPRFNPLIVHVPDLASARRVGVLDGRAEAVAARFWPGPLTLVLAKAPVCQVADLATAGLETVGVRVPAHAVAQALLRAAARPIVAPSANKSGQVSPTRAEHVAGDFAADDVLILDGGATAHGLESTVLDLSAAAPRLLRPGAVTAAALATVLGVEPVRVAEGGVQPASPGMLASHYAPHAPVRLDATAFRPGEAVLAFGNVVPPHDGPICNLSASGDLVEAAANLFAMLRELDRPGVAAIAVMPIADQGLGEAINDRLRRAAAPRA